MSYAGSRLVTNNQTDYCNPRAHARQALMNYEILSLFQLWDGRTFLVMDSYLKDKFNCEYLILRFDYPSHFAGTNNCGIEQNQPHPLIIV